MSKSYDASIKELFERRPADWLNLAGFRPEGDVRLVNADLSSVPDEADRVIWVDDRVAWLANIEIQANRDPDLARRLFRYNAMIDIKFGMPVASVVILLRREADSPEWTGILERELPGQPPYLRFHYRVVRVWTLSAEELLRGSLATLPLALIADAPEAKLPWVARRVEERLRAEATPSEFRVLRTIAELLLGLSRTKGEVDMLFNMDWIEESSVYKAMVEKGRREGLAEGQELGREQGLKQGVEQGLSLGRIEELRSLIWKAGARLKGKPSRAFREVLDAEQNRERLEAIFDRILEAKSWDEVLGG